VNLANPSIVNNIPELDFRFSATPIAERDAFHRALIDLVGKVRDSVIMHGGDLCTHPYSTEQQEMILSASSGRAVLAAPVLALC
jgi:hypothetical protein